MGLLLSLDGVYIGINGCSLKTEDNLEVVRAVPCNRLMIETDAPWCGIKRTHASYPFVRTHFAQSTNKKHCADKCVKGRAEPCHIVQVLEVIAAVKGMNIDELADVVYQNTLSVFFPNEAKGLRESGQLQDCNDKEMSDVEEWREWLLMQHRL